MNCRLTSDVLSNRLKTRLSKLLFSSEPRTFMPLPQTEKAPRFATVSLSLNVRVPLEHQSLPRIRSQPILKILTKRRKSDSTFLLQISNKKALQLIYIHFFIRRNQFLNPISHTFFTSFLNFPPKSHICFVYRYQNNPPKI